MSFRFQSCRGELRGPLRLDHNSGVAERGSYAASQAGYVREGNADEKGACLLVALLIARFNMIQSRSHIQASIRLT